MLGLMPSQIFFRSLGAALTLLLVSLSTQAQTYAVIHNFAGAPTDGGLPNGELIQDAGGNLYGTTNGIGNNNPGVVFRLDPNGEATILYKIGGFSEAGLLLDAEGNLYGTTTNPGTVFKLDTENNLKTLHMFGLRDDGGTPRSRLVTINGDLYGVTVDGGGSNCACGTIFKMTKGGTETILYSFTGGADGAYPLGLFRDSAGNLYGVTSTNLTAPGAGTVYELDTAGVFKVLYTFTGGADGGAPVGNLTRDTNGNIHGVASSGGDPTCNCGVVFRVDASGNETVLHKFFGHGGGSKPNVGVLDVGGILYGTSELGGDLTCDPPSGCGVLYQIGKTGQYTVLHRFAGAAVGDGAYNAFGGLTLGADGSIYGATWFGGTGTGCSGSIPGCGVIFKYTP